MDIRLAYGKDGLSIDVPDWVQVDRFGLSTVEKPAGYPEFSAAVVASGLADLLACESLLVVVNDGHRPTPTPTVLGWLDRHDSSFLSRARFLIACGTHAAPTPEHLLKVFGPFLDRVRDRIAWHDCRDLSSMVEVGRDRFGQPVYLKREAAAAERILVITSVEPHYFAGFTGGRKSFFPGLSDLATIERNHNMANSLECMPLRLIGNPMSEHLHELLGLIDLSKVGSIQIVADVDHRPAGVFCGDLVGAFEAAARAARELYAYPVTEPYDLVLAEVRPPLDRSLYQIQKGLENTQMGVRDGGTDVVVGYCEDGVGSKPFFELAAIWDREKNAPSDGVTRFGSHKLSRVNAMTRRIKVRIFSTLPPDAPRRVFYEPVSDLQALMGECLSADRNRLAIVHDAGHAVLELTSVT